MTQDHLPKGDATINTRIGTKGMMTALLLSLTVVAPLAKAQGSKMLAKATVPFQFEYSHHVFPAGTYSFLLSGEHVLVVSGAAESALGMVLRDDATQIGRGRLRFRHVGASYVLNELSLPGTGTTLVCPRSKAVSRRELARAAEPVPETSAEVALLDVTR